MSKIDITRIETRMTFNYEGEKYDINGTVSFNKEDESITQMEATITDKGAFIGNANVSLYSGEKPKISINSVEVDRYTDVTSDLTACLAALKLEVAKTVAEVTEGSDTNDTSEGVTE